MTGCSCSCSKKRKKESEPSARSVFCTSDDSQDITGCFSHSSFWIAAYVTRYSLYQASLQAAVVSCLAQVANTMSSTPVYSTPPVQVDHMTKLMLDGGREESEDKENRKENRRETWAPGLAGMQVLPWHTQSNKRQAVCVLCLFTKSCCGCAPAVHLHSKMPCVVGITANLGLNCQWAASCFSCFMHEAGLSAGQRNRKRALPPKAENSPVVDSKPLEGRKSEPEAVFAVPPNLEAVTPPPQRRKSMAGLYSCILRW